jgi:hypothetical protein
MTRPGFEPGLLWWEAGDYPPELWRGLRIIHRTIIDKMRKQQYYTII